MLQFCVVLGPSWVKVSIYQTWGCAPGWCITGCAIFLPQLFGAELFPLTLFSLCSRLLLRRCVGSEWFIIFTQLGKRQKVSREFGCSPTFWPQLVVRVCQSLVFISYRRTALIPCKCPTQNVRTQTRITHSAQRLHALASSWHPLPEDAHKAELGAAGDSALPCVEASLHYTHTRAHTLFTSSLLIMLEPQGWYFNGRVRSCQRTHVPVSSVCWLWTCLPVQR